MMWLYKGGGTLASPPHSRLWSRPTLKPLQIPQLRLPKDMVLDNHGPGGSRQEGGSGMCFMQLIVIVV